MVVWITEEYSKPETEDTPSIIMCIPVRSASMLTFVIPICFTLPPLDNIRLSRYGQTLPSIIDTVTG
jgi:hypothetical protein